MKKISNENINTKHYWNGVYSDERQRAEFSAQDVFAPGRFIETVKHIKDGDKVLDIGCGIGSLTKMVKDTYPNCEVWGVDISDTAINDDQAERPDIKYVHGYIGKLKDIPENYFDVVFSGETLEHLDNPNDLINDAYCSLKEGGVFLLTTPNKNAIFSTEHIYEFEQDDVEKFLRNCGFKTVEFLYLPDLVHLLVIYAKATK